MESILMIHELTRYGMIEVLMNDGFLHTKVNPIHGLMDSIVDDAEEFDVYYNPNNKRVVLVYDDYYDSYEYDEDSEDSGDSLYYLAHSDDFNVLYTNGKKIFTAEEMEDWNILVKIHGSEKVMIGYEMDYVSGE